MKKWKILGLVLVILLLSTGCYPKDKLSEMESQINELKTQQTQREAQIEAQINGLKGELAQKETWEEEQEAQTNKIEERILDLEKVNSELQKEVVALREELGKADESEKPVTKSAKIEISFKPDPAPCENGEWRWRVTLKEVNGVGVKINDITMELQGEDDIVIGAWRDKGWLEVIKNYLPAYSSAYSSRLAFCQQSVTHAIFTVTGVDDNGHAVVVKGRVELSQQPASTKTAAIEITFDPNPVACKDNKYIWKTILTEVNGIGVHLKEITRRAYIRDILDDATTIDNESKQWNGLFLKDLFPPDAYLPASGSLDFKGGFPYGSVTRQYTHCIFIVIGVDENGNEIRFEGRVDFVQ